MSNNSLLVENFTCTSAPADMMDCQAHLRHYNNFLQSMIVINALVALVASFLNLLTMFTFVKTTSLRTPSNLLLLIGLSISDLGFSLFSQPVFCVYLYATLTGKAELDETSGSIFYNSFLLLAFVSFGTLTAISADRFLAIHLHLRYQELVTTRRYVMVFVVIWITSTILLVCRLLVDSHYRIIIEIFASVGLLVLNAYFFFKISKAINKHLTQMEVQQQSVQQSIDIPRYKKSVNTMYYVIGAFVFGYIPFIGTFITMFVVQDSTKNLCIFLTLTPTLLMFNGVLNPIIYCIRNREIRNAVSKLLHRIIHKFEKKITG